MSRQGLSMIIPEAKRPHVGIGALDVQYDTFQRQVSVEIGDGVHEV